MVLSADSFNRTNSTNNLGSTDGAGSLDPLTWTQGAGTLGINSSQGYASAFGALAVAVVELSQADIDISITFTTISTAGVALVFRYASSSSFWIWYTSGTTSALYKYTGTFAQVGSGQTGAAAGDVMRVRTTGNSVNVYRNGVNLIGTTDSFNASATKHGFYFDSDTTGRVDDFTASLYVVITTATGTQATETDSAMDGTATSTAISPTSVQAGDHVLAFKTATSNRWFGFDLDLIR